MSATKFIHLGSHAKNVICVAFSILHVEAWDSENHQIFVPLDLLEDCMEYLPVRMVVCTADDAVRCADGGIEEIYCDGRRGMGALLDVKDWSLCRDLMRSPRLAGLSSSKTTTDHIWISLVKAAWHNQCGRNEESRQYIRNAETVAITLDCFPTSVEVLRTALVKYDVTTDPKVLKIAFDNAIARLDELSDEEYREAVTLMQHIRDELTLAYCEEDDD
eukprot:PhF_6_TR12894/c0_g4_i7/m.20300